MIQRLSLNIAWITKSQIKTYIDEPALSVVPENVVLGEVGVHEVANVVRTHLVEVDKWNYNYFHRKSISMFLFFLIRIFIILRLKGMKRAGNFLDRSAGL